MFLELYCIGCCGVVPMFFPPLELVCCLSAPPVDGEFGTPLFFTAKGVDLKVPILQILEN